MSSIPPEPDQRSLILYVGQDRAGHWLVQDSGKRLEGRFISFATAMSFARAEGQLYRASIEVASRPLSPLVPFTRAAEQDRPLARAA